MGSQSYSIRELDSYLCLGSLAPERPVTLYKSGLYPADSIKEDLVSGMQETITGYALPMLLLSHLLRSKVLPPWSIKGKAWLLWRHVVGATHQDAQYSAQMVRNPSHFSLTMHSPLSPLGHGREGWGIKTCFELYHVCESAAWGEGSLIKREKNLFQIPNADQKVNPQLDKW